MTIEIGKTYVFDYPEHVTTLPEYSKHRGKHVRVTKDSSPDDHDDRDSDRMYTFICLDDAWEGEAFESELLEI